MLPDAASSLVDVLRTCSATEIAVEVNEQGLQLKALLPRMDDVQAASLQRRLARAPPPGHALDVSVLLLPSMDDTQQGTQEVMVVATLHASLASGGGPTAGVCARTDRAMADAAAARAVAGASPLHADAQCQ